MLTIKYRMTDAAEVIEDGFTFVTYSVGQFMPRPDLPDDHSSNSEKLYRVVVTGHRPDGSTITYGPVIAVQDTAPTVEPIVWVMNEGGATVAKYSLL